VFVPELIWVCCQPLTFCFADLFIFWFGWSAGLLVWVCQIGTDLIQSGSLFLKLTLVEREIHSGYLSLFILSSCIYLLCTSWLLNVGVNASAIEIKLYKN
jgi:hypothetical protein